MKLNQIKSKEQDRNKRIAISSIITVVFLVLISTVLVGFILSWSKNEMKDKLDVSKENLKTLSDFECKNFSIKLEECTVDYVSKEISFLITNKSSFDIFNLTLSIQGNNFDGEDMKLTGNFSSKVLPGETKLFSTNNNNFNYYREDYNKILFDIESVSHLALTNSSCPNKIIDLKDCEIIYDSLSWNLPFSREWFLFSSKEGYGSSLVDINIFSGDNIDNNLNIEQYNGSFVQSNSGTFDGNDDYIIVSDSNFLDFNTSDFSFGAWVKVNSINTGFNYILDKGTGSLIDGYGIEVSSTAFSFVTDGTDASGAKLSLSSNTMTDIIGKWHHVFCVRKSGVKYIYVDGVMQSTIQADARELSDVSRPFTIGKPDVDSGYFSGSVSDVRVYNRALSLSDVYKVYLGTDNNYSGLLLWYPLSEGAGNIAFNVSKYSLEYVNNFDFNTNNLSFWSVLRGTFTWNAAGDATYVCNDISSTAVIHSSTMISAGLGKTYRIKFRAKSTNATNTLLTSVSGASAIPATAIKNPALTTTYQDYEFIGTTTSINTIQFIINFGGVASGWEIGKDCTIDDISITEVYPNGSIVIGTNGNKLIQQFWENKQDVFHYNLNYGFSNSLYFDGNNDYAEKIDIFGSSNISKEATISFKTYLISPSGSYDTYLDFLASGGIKLYQTKYSSYSIFSAVVSDAVTDSNSGFSFQFPYNQWYDIAVTIKAGEYKKLYVNGVLKQTITITDVNGNINNNSTKGIIGKASYAGEEINTYLSDLKIWNKALTDSEVYEVYNNIIPQDTNLIAWYKMNQGTGLNILVDSSSRNNNMTMYNFDNNLYGWGRLPRDINTSNLDVSGKTLTNLSNSSYLNNSETKIIAKKKIISKDNAVGTFDGNDDYISIKSATPGLKSFGTTGDFTISAWAKKTNAENLGTILCAGYGGHSYCRYMIGIAYTSKGQTAFVSLYPGAALPAYKQLNGSKDLYNTWAHITAVFSRSEQKIKLYVNGSLDSQIDWNGSIEVESNYDLFIGARSANINPNALFKGNISDVRLYSKGLSSDEVYSLYNGSYRDTNNLSAWYPLSEGAGKIAFDVSGNKNHGMIYSTIDIEKVSNSNFSSWQDTNTPTGWTIVGATSNSYTYNDSNTLRIIYKANDSPTFSVKKVGVLEAKKIYRLSFDISYPNTGGIVIYRNWTNAYFYNVNTTTINTYYHFETTFLAGWAGDIEIKPSNVAADTNIGIDNFSIKEIDINKFWAEKYDISSFNLDYGYTKNYLFEGYGISSSGPKIEMQDTNTNTYLDSNFSFETLVFSYNADGYRHPIFRKKDVGTGAALGCSLYVYTGKYYNFICADGNTSVQATSVFDTNRFHHVVGTYDNTNKTIKLYVDGVLKNIGTNVSLQDIKNNYFFNLGSQDDSSLSFRGIIRYAKVYNRVLSDNDVNQLYLGNTISSGLINYWNLSDFNSSYVPDLVGSKNGVIYGYNDIYLPRDVNTTSKDVSVLGLLKTNTASLETDNNTSLKLKRYFETSSSGTFDGVNDYANCNINNLGITNQMSVSALVYVPLGDISSYRYGIASEWNTGSSPGTNEWSFAFGYSATNATPSFGFENGSTTKAVSSDFNISRDSWHLITVVKDINFLYLYIDGNLVKTADGIGNVNNIADRNLFIGTFYANGSPTSYSSSMRVSDLRIYNRAISSSEVMNIYNGIDNNFDNLVAWYPFSEGAGGLVYDVSGNKRDCNIVLGATGNTTYSQFWNNTQNEFNYNTRFGNNSYVYLDGVDDYLEFNHYSFQTNTYGSYSIWVNTKDTRSIAGVYGLFSQLEDSSLQIGIDQGKPGIYYYNYSSASWVKLTVNKLIADGNWHNIVFVMDSNNNNWKVYVDNNLEKSENLTGLGTLWIDAVGKSRYYAPFNGFVSDIRFYNRLLSASDVNQIYNNQDLNTGLVSWYIPNNKNQDLVYDLISNNHAVYNASARPSFKFIYIPRDITKDNKDIFNNSLYNVSENNIVMNYNYLNNYYYISSNPRIYDYNSLLVSNRRLLRTNNTWIDRPVISQDNSLDLNNSHNLFEIKDLFDLGGNYKVSFDYNKTIGNYIILKNSFYDNNNYNSSLSSNGVFTKDINNLQNKDLLLLTPFQDYFTGNIINLDINQKAILDNDVNDALFIYGNNNYGLGINNDINGSIVFDGLSNYLYFNDYISSIKTIYLWVYNSQEDNSLLKINNATIGIDNNNVVVNGIDDYKVYVNGVEDNQVTLLTWNCIVITFPESIDIDSFYLGKIDNNFFNGNISIFRLYNKELEINEIKGLYITEKE